MRHYIISYVCVPRFNIWFKFLFFMPNHGHFKLKSPCSSPNGLLFTPTYSSGYVPMINVPPVHCGGWGGFHAQRTFYKPRGKCGFKWMSLRRCSRNYFDTRN